jgi:hypothetical protein
MFIATFITTCHLSISWVISVQSAISHPISLTSTLILYSYLCLCLPSGFLSSDFPVKILYAFLLTLCMLHDPPSYPPWFCNRITFTEHVIHERPWGGIFSRLPLVLCRSKYFFYCMFNYVNIMFLVLLPEPCISLIYAWNTNKCTNYPFNLLIIYGSSYMFRHYIAILMERS